MSSPFPVLRFARPTEDIERMIHFYQTALGLTLIASFDNHNGFDGRILAPGQNAPWHLEFTYQHPASRSQDHSVRAPTQDNLLVLYLPDPEEYVARKKRMEEYGYESVKPVNEWWERYGVTFEDFEGWRVVLCHSSWTS